MQVEVRRGPAIHKYISDLARLRIEVFAEWPYLYSGSVEYEERYLSHLAGAKSAALVLVSDAGDVVGASTALALEEEPESLWRPFVESGKRPGDWYYLAESVLKREYRGRGLGHRFFDGREGVGHELGYRNFTFCAVERRADDPRRDSDYFDLDRFWHKRGYTPSQMLGTLSWREHHETADSEKQLRFWLKAVSGNRAGA